MADSRSSLTPVLEALGLKSDDALSRPSWNGKPLDEVYPWGTIRKATPEANRATANELSPKERDEVGERAWQYLEVFGYDDFLT